MENKDIELRSEQIRKIIGQVPPVLVRSGIGIKGIRLPARSHHEHLPTNNQSGQPELFHCHTLIEKNPLHTVWHEGESFHYLIRKDIAQKDIRVKSRQLIKRLLLQFAKRFIPTDKSTTDSLFTTALLQTALQFLSEGGKQTLL